MIVSCILMYLVDNKFDHLGLFQYVQIKRIQFQFNFQGELEKKTDISWLYDKCV
jgi:hypothetical protein